MTSFYLLLSTGAYACLLHCATDYFYVQLAKNGEAFVSGNDHTHDEKESDEDCKKGDCNCCYHHGTYVVKENAKAHAHFTFRPADVATAILQADTALYIPLHITSRISWPRPTGPPFLHSQPIYISNKALLI
ncbi:hypothetical protein DIU31_022305 [Mucilaginibacter rubeus]|uniref:DUF2946 domain-containing protein n=3 Tax=Mucilaginibacter rubeus TaxID=2027860 RepID=A0A364WYI7_9SPHI|nr:MULTISPECIES: hypothetical protein [Mucilaginibacter]QEM06111.1 hypothetical protein DIU31_022305 [Mucilaginibacter rubeus]QEM13628.1 hypothetical protein DEO27_027660 [Mucilaginibacter rubeus]QEM18691.1 hypothetical protein DIU38_022530 [Mucilaginibacter gossypii]QTE36314.1 hypothetical protein J3L18_24765 [Mucilaginibacter gossypii]QTE44767.1 hypothetical protein J3L19_05190 [Mucilaginibacter rubeus]